MTKKIILFIFIPVILILGIIIIIDAGKISGFKLSQINETNYEIDLSGQKYMLRYVPEENISPLFGRAWWSEFGDKFVLVRNDLPKPVQNFVMHHEIYHLYDFEYKLHSNKISQEVHANLAAFPYDPLGAFVTVYMTLTDSTRLKYYFKLIY